MNDRDVDEKVNQIVALASKLRAARSEVFEGSVPTATGGREVYQWREPEDGADSWLTFCSRYTYETRPVLWKFGRAILSSGFTLVLDPTAMEKLNEDEQQAPDTEIFSRSELQG